MSAKLSYDNEAACPLSVVVSTTVAYRHLPPTYIPVSGLKVSSSQHHMAVI